MSAPLPVELLDWGRPRLRDLPWRRTREPWPVLVAEVMLQQTQVDRVVPRWERFLDRFPDPAACAGAPVGDVLREWSGLGYNRRAVNLHRCATRVVALHAGLVPADLDALLALPGVGPYTARAVLAFAFEVEAAVVDTNVARVLARRAGHRLSAGEAQALADGAAPPGQAWAWNQVLLDLGAVVCRAREPRCGECPVADGCAWRGMGPDPANGSAGVGGRQPRFEGSDRQGRGRLVSALSDGPVPADRLAEVMGWPDDPERAGRVAAGVRADGLAVRCGSGYRLP